MAFYDLINLLFNLFFSIILWPIVTGLYYWNSLRRVERLVVLFLIALLLLEIASHVLGLLRVRNHYMHYLDTFTVLWFGALFYANRQAKKWWPVWLAAFVSCLVPIEVFGLVGFNHINTITESIAKLLLVVYSFNQLRQLINHTDGNSLRQQPVVYYHLGFFIYGFFSAITSMFKNYFIETALDLYFFFDTLSVILSAVAFCLFAIGLRLSSAKRIGQLHV